ncbi:M56 family metallopeptidase [Catellatospora aurea]|uniref:M56 family metallopeptidase n=1 Tax=Catellatospora aurea TaxID=1337874 RepID=A0ABW2H088_9ACTN
MASAPAISWRALMHIAECLLLYGLAVSLLAPAVLARVRLGVLAPRLAVAAWLIALVTVVAGWAAAGAVAAAQAHATASRALAWILLGALTVRVMWGVCVTAWQASARRARHRDGLVLLGRADNRLGAIVVDSGEAMVYCLPGRRSLIVVTTAAQQTLSGEQMRAALAHERAHVAGHHHVALMLAFGLARAVPWLPLFALAGRHVGLLLEMSADDDAARRHGRTAVAGALAALSLSAAPASALSATGGSVHLRASRLTGRVPGWRRRGGGLALASLGALLAAGPYLAVVSPWCLHPWL